MDKTLLMTGYEKRLCSGLKQSAADLLKDNKMVANALKNCLGTETERQLESGEVVNIPLVYDLLIELLAYWKQHPERIDLKVLSQVLGETKEVEPIDKQTATDIFKGVVSGAKPNDTDTRPEK